MKASAINLFVEEDSLLTNVTSDKYGEITDSAMSYSAEDTRILLDIKCEKDKQTLQNDLRKLYVPTCWQILRI